VIGPMRNYKSVDVDTAKSSGGCGRHNCWAVLLRQYALFVLVPAICEQDSLRSRRAAMTLPGARVVASLQHVPDTSGPRNFTK